MITPEKEVLSTFQYHAQLDLPIYLTVNLADFDSGLTGFLTSCGFDIIPTLSENDLENKLAQKSKARILRLEEAGARVASQIKGVRESDAYGLESIVPQQGYRVYRYCARALVMMSFSAKEWKAGALSDFGSEAFVLSDRSIVNRYLSWALSTMGIVGFWGEFSQGKLHLLRQKEAQGKVVFVDWNNQYLMTEGEVYSLSASFEMTRRNSLQLRESKLSFEEALSALSAHCSYFSYDGLSLPIRQVIQAMAKTSPVRTRNKLSASVACE